MQGTRKCELRNCGELSSCFRKGGQMDPFLDLEQLFDPSNGGM